jgi:hypothetical protein|tara:strand:+ start:691 stop:1599 length:909 start_codon:yes stop_codon:yes gene_type:complete
MKSFKYFNESYSDWTNEEPVNYAKKLEKAFGRPHQIVPGHCPEVAWHGVDGFKKIVVKDEYILHSSPTPHHDFVYCYIDLKVPTKLGTALANSSESIGVDYLKGEVWARCGSLSANATTLNYVMDVVAGRVQPSKEEYEGRINSIKSGKGPDWWENNLNEGGLWANIHAKRERIKRGSKERMRKPGSKGAPTPSQMSRAQEEVERERTMLSFKNFIKEDDMKGMSVSSGHKRSVDSGAGMTQKGVAAYRRRNPGSKLKTAVTTPPSKLKAGSKAAGRRKAFCSRSKSWTGPRGKAARRRWNC